MRVVGSAWQRPTLQTLYVGGGTPTVLASEELVALFEAAATAFALATDAEITVEANPGTVGLATLQAIRASGANRLSLGIQSFSSQALRLLGRMHTAEQARAAMALARRAGFTNLNLDLIYGLPEQSLTDWQADLEAALACAPDHLSLYALTVEAGTPLQARISCGEVPAPDAEAAAAMYEWSEEYLESQGYIHYELSNWAKPGCECRHNVTYWHNLPYIGCGAAAHSWLRGRRLANVSTPQEYILRVASGESPVTEEEAIAPDLERAETMILGLRLVQGVERASFGARFGADPLEIYAGVVAECVELGLLEVATGCVRLTQRGRLLGNQVFWRFLP